MPAARYSGRWLARITALSGAALKRERERYKERERESVSE
jgi:hypothetical protein